MQKRASILSTGKKKAEARFDTGEALMGEVLVWPVATDYRIAPSGLIAPEPGCKSHLGVRSFPPPSPLKDSEMYLSFANLAYGRNAPKRVLEWVSGHGLLTRKDPSKGGDVLLNEGVVNQEPMRVDDFVAHAAKFEGLLRLYAEVFSGNAKAIASRIGRRASVVDERLASNQHDSESMRGRLPASFEYRASYAKHPLLWIADQVLCDMVAEALDGVRIRPVSGFAVPWETSSEELADIRAASPPPYVPANSFTCPDLLSALYLQLFIMMNRRMPMRRCEGCGLPLPQTARKDQRHHNSTCRSKARHKRERAARLRISSS